MRALQRGRAHSVEISRGEGFVLCHETGAHRALPEGHGIENAQDSWQEHGCNFASEFTDQAC